jgi:hypothetical protein
MKNEGNTFFGLKGAAFVVLAGIMAANCGGKSNPAPGNTGGSGGATGKAGSGGTTGAGGAGGAAASGGAGGGAPDAAAGGAGGAPDAGAGDAGDAATGCDASAVSQDAGCMACSTDPLFACPPTGLIITCLPFNNSVIPANIPKL